MINLINRGKKGLLFSRILSLFLSVLITAGLAAPVYAGLFAVVVTEEAPRTGDE